MHRRIVGVACATGLLVALAACGGRQPDTPRRSPDPSPAAAPQSPPREGIDRSFIDEMVEHHKVVIALGQLAARQAEHRRLRDLAVDVADIHEDELSALQALASQVTAPPSEAGMALPEELKGMRFEISEVRAARPFDRRFIDVMLGLLRGTGRMVDAQLAQGKDPRVRELAAEFRIAQTAVASQLAILRSRWYPARSRAEAPPPPLRTPEPDGVPDEIPPLMGSPVPRT